MPTYSASGTEPLRSNPSPKTSAPASSDAGAGKPAGGREGLRTFTTTLAATQLKSPTGGADRKPSAVKSFTDNKV